MPTKVVRTSIARHPAPGRGRGPHRRTAGAPRSLIDEATARVRINKFNRLEPLANAIDTDVDANVADVLESYSTKHVS